MLYGIKIPKKLCGYCYFLEASLSGNRNSAKKNHTGLYIYGYCLPRIIKSKWSVSGDGTPAGKEKIFAYGEKVYLNLDTEGINGYPYLTIEIYAHKTLASDPLTRTITNVKVTDGEINIEINNTSIWYGKHSFPNHVMEFYVKVKLPNGKYIQDPNGDYIHARYLRIKPEFKNQIPEIPQNTTASKVGIPDINKRNYHSCHFKNIEIKDSIDTFYIFEDGKTLLKDLRVTSRKVTQTVYFKYDRYDLIPEAKKTLDILIDFLLYNPFLDIILEGHADEQGNLDYNQNLSEKRAQSVKDYLLYKGLKDELIKIRGFGEARNATKNATNEQQHAKNRRTTIEFRYNEYDNSAMLYQTLAGSELKTKEISINLQNFQTKGCIRKNDKHEKQIEIKSKNSKVISEGNEVTVKKYLFYLICNSFSCACD
ncbi:hypothetical protein BWK58_05405 [Flavobacterium columnare]|nr:hypothetical protein BWK58_05405 [Flavobacterium columnare]